MSSDPREDRRQPQRHSHRRGSERQSDDRHKEHRRTPPRGSSGPTSHDLKRRRLSPSDPDYRRASDRGDPPRRADRRRSPSGHRDNKTAGPGAAEDTAGGDRPPREERSSRHAASGGAQHRRDPHKDRSRDHHSRDRDAGRDSRRDGAKGRGDSDKSATQTSGDRERGSRHGEGTAAAQAQQHASAAPTAAVAATGYKRNVDDYDYIVPTGGRHYEHDDRDVVTFGEERGRHGGGPKILYDDGPVREPGRGRARGWGQPWGGRGGGWQHEGPVGGPRFTADNMQHEGLPRTSRAGGFGAGGKWTHDKFEELGSEKADTTAVP